MQLVASLLLLNGGALAAQIAARAVGVSPSLTTRSTPNMRFSLRQSCDEGQECADGCIPSDAQCCDVIVGIYCEASEGYCTTSNTCCPEGLECTGNDDSSRECTDDETRCGLSCIASDAECCDEDLGSYCENSTTCLSSTTCDLTNSTDPDDNPSSDDTDDTDDSDSTGSDPTDTDNNDDNSDSNSNSNNDDNSNSNSNNDDDDEDDDSNSNSNNSNDDTDAGFSVGPSMALVVFGAILTTFF